MNTEDAEFYEKRSREILEEQDQGPISGGFISGPIEGCNHDWKPYDIVSSGGIGCVVASISRCSKCYILADFPESE